MRVRLGAETEAVRDGLSRARVWSCQKFMSLGKLWDSRANRIISPPQCYRSENLPHFQPSAQPSSGTGNGSLCRQHCKPS